MALSGRLIPPPASTQEQRVRLRNSHSLEPVQPKRSFDDKNPDKLAEQRMHLPSADILRALGVALNPLDE